MKTKKQLIVYMAFLILFFGYLFSADYIFNVLLETQFEANRIDMSLPEETRNIRFWIDSLDKRDLRWKKALHIQGWVFQENVIVEPRDVYLVLKGKKRTLVFDIEDDSRERKDVTQYFNLDTDIHNHGFSLYLLIYWLKEDAYQIGFVIDDDSGRHFQMSDRSLVKVESDWVLSGQ